MSEYHVPVLLDASVDGLALKPGGVYVDVTFGGGGHSRRILEKLEGGKLLAFDQDVDARQNLIDDDRLIFVQHNFRFLKNFLRYYGLEKVDGILADLGVSSHEFDEADRGFSFRFDGKLDMRMNQTAEKDAASIVNEYEESELMRIFRTYGEVKNARRLVSLITNARSEEPVNTIGQFLKVIEPCVPAKTEKKYLAQVFQALRIEVNREMDVLRDFLEAIPEVLNPGGRFVAITYHSLEDRMVKNFVRSGKVEGTIEKDLYGNYEVPVKAVNRKPIVPDEDEINDNPRARSAKLRIAERI
ncbi:16S rRNA (cytosine(1402)-N(4))-methyltransferase RsmH [Prolixibacter denitrificans]|uniref:Ribosomal RNA small subunit methyltransferase H n=1 Tax=Prolixibacter denitrificans TaxID=1541063 RepID=A0A2P8CII0_9BACT|nr:16S rRNA (cytosine(1402)-N(4))-methyltransferase RsmH [Prolixibacter denitrificans]PSK84764.1 16S rRNA (cytosine1402-N4)-methyltransferase [Prolixibacter denitrificans]GET20929.1 ribosomal RNA small subunit methyltransferase H [Prolixibacter denitrificans]